VKKAGVEVALFNLPAGDWAKGERGIACHPGRQGEPRPATAGPASRPPTRTRTPCSPRSSKTSALRLISSRKKAAFW
jgi:hypothetical protein